VEQPAYAAFRTGLNISLAIAAALMLLSLIVALTTIRRPSTPIYLAPETSEAAGA